MQTDGWAGHAGLEGAAYGHGRCARPTGAGVDERLPWLRILFSDFKRRTLGIFDGVSPALTEAYLHELSYLFTRRGQREDILRRFLDRCVLSVAPAPCSLP